eukprot:547164-Pelagomonas_calceolata.AAC.4
MHVRPQAAVRDQKPNAMAIAFDDTSSFRAHAGSQQPHAGHDQNLDSPREPNRALIDLMQALGSILMHPEGPCRLSSISCGPSKPMHALLSYLADEQRSGMSDDAYVEMVKVGSGIWDE